MAPTTCATCRETPPPKSGDYDTITKVRFYDTYDARTPSQSAKLISCRYEPSLPTGPCWLRERRLFSDSILGRLRKRSTCLGRI